MKILATALALGIIIDATIVRGILAPALAAAAECCFVSFGILRMAQPCSVALGAPSRGVQRILDAVDMTEVLAIYDLEADAVQACGRSADDYAYLSSAGLSRHSLLHRI